MRVFRWLRSLARCVLGAALLAPAVALPVAIFVDRGPAGETRFSPHLFPIALWIFDDFAWTCARNSVIFAVVVSLASLVGGVLMGWVIARRRFWGRWILRPLIVALMAVAPAFVALGLLGVLGGPRPWPWPFAVVNAGITGVSLESWSGLPLWIVWIWTTLPMGVAVVTLATAAAVEQLEPSWEDSARLVGMTPLKIWKRLNWPFVRPSSARAAAFVFVMALVEPGAPLILGLRRTLAYQVVQTARRPDAFPAVAVWAVMASLFGLVGWIIWRWLGRSPIKLGDGSANPGSRSFRAFNGTAPLRALATTLPLAAWVIIGWLPLLGLARIALGASRADSASATGLGRVVRDLGEHLNDPVTARLLANSLVLGLVVSSAVTLSAWLVGPDARGASSWWRARLARPMVIMPPLIHGVGVLAIPWLAALASTFLIDLGRWGLLARALGSFSAGLDPLRSPWTITSGALGLVLLPRLFWCWRTEPPPSDMSSHRAGSAFDAAMLAGASRVQANLLSDFGRGRRMIGRFLLVWALAATNLTPALLFEPWTGGQSVAPTVVLLGSGPDDIPAQAAALALCAIAANLAALAIAHATSALPRVRDLD
jgi:ABC-type Fe3+ transport system permease subunit